MIKRVKVEFDEHGVYLSLSEESDDKKTNKITLRLTPNEAETLGEHIFRSARNVPAEA